MDEDTEVMIGLETHVQLDTKTKLFCGCPNNNSGEPNQNVCETCLGHPGSKPRLNEKVIKEALKTSQALQCNINEEIFFSRKTYFYPDMPKNYQITQYEFPVGENGKIEIKVGDEKKSIGITRLHIEEDPAQLKHIGGGVGDSDYSKVDYNRAGTPLLEIVTEPDFTSPKEARVYLQQLAKMLEYLKIYSPETKYSIKSDANISIDGGQRVEVKNITGTAGIEKALSYEISRQKQLKKRGRTVNQQTRSYDQNQEITKKLREKEEEKDYGYIFDPDLTKQKLSKQFQENIKEKIPELPHEKFKRFKEEYDLKEKLIESLITEPSLAKDFEAIAEKHSPEKTAAFLAGDLRKVLNFNDITYRESKIKEEWLEYLIKLKEEGKISDRNAEKALRKIAEEPEHPEKVVQKEDLAKSEDDDISQFIDKAISENQEAVEDYKSGDEEAVNFLVGQVMQLSKGKADPKTTREKIIEDIG